MPYYLGERVTYVDDCGAAHSAIIVGEPFGAVSIRETLVPICYSDSAHYHICYAPIWSIRHILDGIDDAGAEGDAIMDASLSAVCEYRGYARVLSALVTSSLEGEACAENAARTAILFSCLQRLARLEL